MIAIFKTIISTVLVSFYSLFRLLFILVLSFKKFASFVFAIRTLRELAIKITLNFFIELKELIQ